jgi:hypothetical protein
LIVNDGVLARNVLRKVIMSTDRIEFISGYCDRWCERCPFTSRCSSYAVTVATEMCGDFEEALEPAVGRPRPEHGEPDAHIPDWFAEAPNIVPTEKELRAYAQQEAARRKRIEATRLSALAWTYTSRAHT